MKKMKKVLVIAITAGLVLTAACKFSGGIISRTVPTPTPVPNYPVETTEPISEPVVTPEPATQVPEVTVEPVKTEPVDYSVVQPNESGEIPIVMFHNFIKDLNDTTDKEWTTSFSAFSELLETLYHMDYRLISMRDFIEHRIAVPAGKIPMVFTFDDGSAGQFNLIEENGRLVVNPDSAVGVMLKFHEKYPDFGLKGIFYLNMDKEEKTFEGAGSLQERLEILLGYGFEVGNHSWGHYQFADAKDRMQIYEKLGKNEQRLNEVMPGVSFYSLALPYGGNAPEEIRDALIQGEYEGASYHHETIMAVGYLPNVPSIHNEYNSTYVRRIRSQGKEEVQFDLTYWLPLMTRDRMYISDGDPNTIVVPRGKENKINVQELRGKELITY